MKNRPTLVYSHLHMAEQEENNIADPILLHTHLPEGVDLVSIATDYFRPDDHTDRLKRDIELQNGDYTPTETYLTYELPDNKRGAVINGFESDLVGHPDAGENLDSHWIHAFAPWDYEMDVDGSELDGEELEELLPEFDLNWIAHLGSPKFHTPEEVANDVLKSSQEESYELGLGVPEMYHPFSNKLSKGWSSRVSDWLIERTEIPYETGRESTVFDLAEEYETFTVPEQDWKVCVAPKAQGAGYTEEDLVGALDDQNTGEAIEILKNLDVVGSKRTEKPYLWKQPGLTLRQFADSYPIVAGDLTRTDSHGYMERRNKSFDLIDDLTPEELKERAHPL